MGARKANADAMLWWDSFDEGAQFHEPTTFGTPDGGESTATNQQSHIEGTESGSDSSSNISLEDIDNLTEFIKKTNEVEVNDVGVDKPDDNTDVAAVAESHVAAYVDLRDHLQLYGTSWVIEIQVIWFI